MILLALFGCPGDEPDTGQGPFEIVADTLPSGVLLGAWSDGDELIAVGGSLPLSGPSVGGLVRWDGERLCTEEAVTDATLWWIHGSEPGDWYAVGASGRVLHHTGGALVDESVPTESTLYGVWVAADGDVWAVGGDVRDTGLGEVWRRRDGVWSAFATELPGVVFKVWDRWFVGVGHSWHLEGDALVEVPIPEDLRLLTVRGRADDDVYAVGGFAGPALLHWDGAAWTSIEVDLSCANQPLNGVWTAPGEDVYVAGNFGAMARFDGTTWDCPYPPLTGDSFHAVWQHAGQTYWVGGNLFDTTNNHGTLGHLAPPALGTLASVPCAN